MVHYRNKDWFTLKDIMTLLHDWYVKGDIDRDFDDNAFRQETFPVIFSDYTMDQLDTMGGDKLQMYISNVSNEWAAGVIEHFDNYDNMPAFILFNYGTEANSKAFDEKNKFKACIIVPVLEKGEQVTRIERPDGFKISDFPQLLARFYETSVYDRTAFEIEFGKNNSFICKAFTAELASYLNPNLSIIGLKFASYMEGFPYLGIKVSEPKANTSDATTKQLPTHYEIRGGYGGSMGPMSGSGGSGYPGSFIMKSNDNKTKENHDGSIRILDKKLLADISCASIHLTCDDLGDGRVRVNVVNGMHSYGFSVKPTAPTSGYDVLLKEDEQDFFIDGSHLKVKSDSSEEPNGTRIIISTMDEKETTTFHVNHPTSPYIYYGGKRTPIANMKEVGNKHQDQCKQIVINPVDLVTSVDGGLCSVLLKIEKDPNIPNAILVETADGSPIRYFLDSPLNTDSEEHDDSDMISFEPESYLCLNGVKTPIKDHYNHDDYHERNSDKIIIDPEDLIVTDDGKHIAAMIEFRPYNNGVKGKTFMIITNRRSFRRTL